MNLLTKSQRRSIRKRARRQGIDLRSNQAPIDIKVYGELGQLTDAQKLLFLTPGAHPIRQLYDVVIEKDPKVDCNADTPRKKTILQATNQWDPRVNKSIRPMETIMLCDEQQDPNQDRTDPSYKVDFNQSHCNEYELKLVKTMVTSYPDIFAQYKYDLGLAKVDPVDIPTTDDKPVAGKFLRIPYKMREEVLKHENEMLLS